jgi:CheY-like chemotaxis protein
MPAGGPIIIAARTEGAAAGASDLAPGRYVCLSVTDAGEGMDEATLARAAEPFFTTKGVGKGTGLGLPMVHGMAEQSGGRLVLKSRKGEGTTAELWLPVAEAEPKAAEASKAPAAPERTKGITPLVVLVVDDDALVLMNTSAMLEDLGHTVIEATSGQEAIDTLRRETGVDLVVTDQAMPQMTGAQLAHAIRAEWPNLPIILATGYAELPPDVRIDCPKLAKPFREADLARVIAETMRTVPGKGRVLQFRAG